jgi:hypothetical protein
VRDLLLKTVRTPTHPWKSEKLGVNFTGPWEVLSVHKNDYTCKHITQNTIETFHVTMLKPYWGRLKPAKRVALLDFDQHVVVSVSDYTGDPNLRKTCELNVYFADEPDNKWLVWNEDFSRNESLQLYCRSIPQLWQLLYSTKEVSSMITKMNKLPITSVAPGDTLYVDLRALGAVWYNQLDLAQCDTVTYVTKCDVREYLNRTHTKIRIVCPLLKVYLDWNPAAVMSWGQYTTRRPDHILINPKFLASYPRLEKSLASSRSAYADLFDASKTSGGKKE